MLSVGIYLSGIHPSIASQIWGSLLSGNHVTSLTTIFCATLRVTIGMLSSPFSLAFGNMTPPSALAVLTPQACDDGLPPHFDGDHPPCGHDHNSFLPCR